MSYRIRESSEGYLLTIYDGDLCPTSIIDGFTSVETAWRYGEWFVRYDSNDECPGVK